MIQCNYMANYAKLLKMSFNTLKLKGVYYLALVFAPCKK